MAGDTALTKVMLAIADRITPAPQVQTFVDRSESNPLQESEVPAQVVNCVDVGLTEYQENGHGQCYWWDVTLHFDLYENFEVFTTITDRHRTMAANIVALINAEWGLGGMLQNCVFTGLSNAEDVRADYGAAVLELKVSFLTKFDDWTVGIGGAGLF